LVTATAENRLIVSPSVWAALSKIAPFIADLGRLLTFAGVPDGQQISPTWGMPRQILPRGFSHPVHDQTDDFSRGAQSGGNENFEIRERQKPPKVRNHPNRFGRQLPYRA
jgi:hypothetical protein